MPPDDIFDRAARRLARGRMLDAAPPDRWIVERMGDELLERLEGISTPPARALVIGCPPGLDVKLRSRGVRTFVADPSYRLARAAGGVQCDEDRLAFADRSFDLVLAIGSLDTVNDLPGAMILARRVLREGGLFLGAMAGAGSLPALRHAVSMGTAGGVARFHPQIDVRAAGDLLARAGFSMPVADTHGIDVRYTSFARLGADLRANGLRNQLARRQRLTRHEASAVAAAFTQAGEKRTERIELLVLTGWAPPLQEAGK